PTPSDKARVVPHFAQHNSTRQKMNFRWVSPNQFNATATKGMADTWAKSAKPTGKIFPDCPVILSN
ncbi:MAG: hypothetical protein N2039_05835, partial [Gemmataceae bacterium]|nr:hypothetical protein [Gemmataceae bacterium]